MGTSLVGMASWSWMSGNMTGNGPVDRQTRQLWLDLGWKPRSIKIGDVWVSYESIEPFNQTWSMIADIGVASQLMGAEWTEDQLQKVSLIIAQGIASKSYLQGMQLWVDAFGGQPGKWGQVGSSLINNTVPLASLRNEMGKIFTPYTRELGSGITDAIRNRNLITENIAAEPLPIKYDILNGKPVKDFDFLTRLAKSFLPVDFNFDYSPGRQFLLNSGYDMRLMTYTAPDGTDLSENEEIRSLFQKELGKLNMEVAFNRMSKRHDVQQSLLQMDNDRASGFRGDYEPRDYFHNKLIRDYVNKQKKIAWLRCLQKLNVQALVAEQANRKLNRKLKQLQTTPNYESLLSMYK